MSEGVWGFLMALVPCAWATARTIGVRVVVTFGRVPASAGRGVHVQVLRNGKRFGGK
jgi:hypothetical protein